MRIVLLLLLAACGGSGPMPDCATVVPNQVPAERNALFDYLVCRGHESQAKESSVHPATSAHPSMARVYINDLLEQSLASGATDHPVGAASVKEIYRADGEALRGWAVMVKVESSAWYWYENYDTKSTDSPVADSIGAGICTGCHSAGRDFFLTPFPLQ